MRLGVTTLALAAALVSGPAALPAPADVAVHVDIDAGRRYDDRYGRHDYRGHPREAWQRGYERGADDGYDKGRSDARKHRRFDPWRHSRFRSATSGYRSRFGPRSAYRDGYREGFARAYERGYSRARHDRGWRDRDGRRRGSW